MLRACVSLTRGMSGLAISGPRQAPSLVSRTLTPSLVTLTPSLAPVRHMSGFYRHGEADALWKTMAGVSAQGKKRGRARNTMRKKNLNAKKMLGFGPAKLSWPGLTESVVTGAGKDTKVKSIAPIKEEVYTSYQEKLQEAIKAYSYGGGRRGKVDPLERGWSGGKAPGRHFGAPEAANKELSFDNFDSVLLEFKTVFHMTGNLGRVRRNSILMVTGNGAGAVGFTLSSGKYGNNVAGFKKAVNKAGLRLVYVERYEDRTVYHDFFTQYGKTRIFVKQLPSGSGVRAHRAIQAICQMAGIKDLYASVEGSKNVQHITKAFMLGLLRQKTHQVLADEKQLHLVEMRAERDYFPTVIASPSDGYVRTQEEIGHNEILDYEMICFEGNLPQWRPETKRNSWEGTPGWDKYVRKSWARQSHPEVRMRMRVEHGDQWGSVRSHLYPQYPECVERDWKKYIKMWRERKGAEADD